MGTVFGLDYTVQYAYALLTYHHHHQKKSEQSSRPEPIEGREFPSIPCLFFMVGYSVGKVKTDRRSE